MDHVRHPQLAKSFDFNDDRLEKKTVEKQGHLRFKPSLGENKKNIVVEKQGIDPCASCMLSKRSTI